MPTKTDRILGWLPNTFRAQPRPSALYSVVDAFGGELQRAEDGLAAIMLAHWVDRADSGADTIRSLAGIAALYGLKPRGALPIPVPVAPGMPPGAPDLSAIPPLASFETVEEFRAHLKRYVRIFIDGTVTVTGILRIAAEALGLQIAAGDDAIDRWWTRGESILRTVEADPRNAAAPIFGRDSLTANGSPALPALLRGSVELGTGAVLDKAATLIIAVDNRAPMTVNLAAGHSASEVAATIEAALPGLAARIAGGSLILESRSSGPGSRIVLGEPADDAAPRLFGLAPYTYLGRDATAARLQGDVDLSGGVDFRSPDAPRYLRIAIDGRIVAEVDCAAGQPRVAAAAEIARAIDAELGLAVASVVAGRLVLTSPTRGAASRIDLQPAAAQDARARLLGPGPDAALGDDAQPAGVTGFDLSAGVDLSAGARLSIALGDQPVKTIDCAGGDPTRTAPAEIVAALAGAFGVDFAAQRDGRIALTAPVAGAGSRLRFDTAGDAQALDAIFGIAPRVANGAAPTAARIDGTPDLSAGIEVGGCCLLRIALDGAPAQTVDLRDTIPFDRTTRTRVAPDPRALCAAINAALGAGIASTDGKHVTLKSPLTGVASSILIAGDSRTRLRPFVTRAFLADDAAPNIFGFPQRSAAGLAATRAAISGDVDLRRGVDLRIARALRLSIDGGAPVEIDCAGARPRATLAAEIVAAIDRQTRPSTAKLHAGVLQLTSPTAGRASRLTFGPGGSALATLFGRSAGTFTGTDATGVVLRSTVDLHAGVTLAPGSALALAIDGAEPVEIDCAGGEPGPASLDAIAARINAALHETVASHDGSVLVLTSPSLGSTARIEIGVPHGPDATRAILGFAPPRSYRGADARPARVMSSADLPARLDLRTTRFISVGVDGKAALDIDCAGPDVATTPAQVCAAINARVPGLAELSGSRLTLRSATLGAAGRLELAESTAGDARRLLLGDVWANTTEAAGQAARPATIAGDVDLLTPVDLSAASILQIAVDGAAPISVDVAGTIPERTSLDDIVAALNRAVPGIATATGNDRLALTSPSADASSRLDLLPVRALELADFPGRIREGAFTLAAGGRFMVTNAGAAETGLELEIAAPLGADWPEIVCLASRTHIRVATSLTAGERVHLRRDARGGIDARRTATDGSVTELADSALVAGPLGTRAAVPFAGSRQFAVEDRLGGPTIVLDAPHSGRVVELRGRGDRATATDLRVSVRDADPATSVAPAAADGVADVVLRGRLVRQGAATVLVDADGNAFARLIAAGAYDLSAHIGRTVAAGGPRYDPSTSPATLVAAWVVDLFDVSLTAGPRDAPSATERYVGVTIGADDDNDGGAALEGRVNIASRLVRARTVGKGEALRFARGPATWRFVDCAGARFDHAQFDAARFPGAGGAQDGVFDISAFEAAADGTPWARFTGGPADAPPVKITARWSEHVPGAFAVNLPDDLPEMFGGRFDQARFATAGDVPETYADVVVDDDPGSAADNLARRISAGSSRLVTAAMVVRVPIGFTAYDMPFHAPRERRFSGGGKDVLGGPDVAAKLYLTDPGAAQYVELTANAPGAWGNGITVTARSAGPARFDVTIGYAGARFENARITVLAGQFGGAAGGALDDRTADILTPRATGVLQAKAAGVRADVTRDRA